MGIEETGGSPERTTTPAEFLDLYATDMQAVLGHIEQERLDMIDRMEQIDEPLNMEARRVLVTAYFEGIVSRVDAVYPDSDEEWSETVTGLFSRGENKARWQRITEAPDVQQGRAIADEADHKYLGRSVLRSGVDRYAWQEFWSESDSAFELKRTALINNASDEARPVFWLAADAQIWQSVVTDLEAGAEVTDRIEANANSNLAILLMKYATRPEMTDEAFIIGLHLGMDEERRANIADRLNPANPAPESSERGSTFYEASEFTAETLIGKASWVILDIARIDPEKSPTAQLTEYLERASKLDLIPSLAIFRAHGLSGDDIRRELGFPPMRRWSSWTNRELINLAK